ncbi:MAG: phosphodiesterase [Solobacterium sp.]|nr:phosphodiesterase [Solobacterium sp.]
MSKKYLVISDLHGSLSSANKALEAFKKHKVDEVLCLGDVLYHGPRNDLPADYNPKEVIPILNQLVPYIVGVRGNCDAEVDQVVLDFPLRDNYRMLKLGKHNVLMTHGHLYDEASYPNEKFDIILSGHTHIPLAYKDNYIFLNPGSMTIPKENHPRSYAIMDDSSFTIYTFADEVYMQIHF